MTSKSKALTGNTRQSSYAENTEALGRQSRQSANSDNTPTSTPTSRKPSLGMLSGATTGEITEKSRQHAAILKVVLSQLLKAGLLRQYKVLSADTKTVREIQIVLDPKVWTEEFELK